MNNPTVNNPILSSKLTALETKLGGEMVVITSYFMDEMQWLKKGENLSFDSTLINPY